MIRIEEYSSDLREFIVMHEEHEISKELKASVAKDPAYLDAIPNLYEAWADAWLTWFVFPNGRKISVMWMPKGFDMMSDPAFEVFSPKDSEVLARVATIREVEQILRKEARL